MEFESLTESCSFIDHFQPDDGVEKQNADAAEDRLDRGGEGVQTLESSAQRGGGAGGGRRFLGWKARGRRIYEYPAELKSKYVQHIL